MKFIKKIVLLFFIASIVSCEIDEINNLENTELNVQDNEVQNFKFNNAQSKLTRIYIEEQRALTKPVAERAALLSKLQNERKAIVEELEKIAFKNNAGLNTAISKNISSKSLSTIRVGSVSNARNGSYGWTLDGNQMPTTLMKLTNLDNFGSSGTYSSQLSIAHVASTLDAATLSNFDIFFIGYWEDGTFSIAELDALFNWVNSSGGSLIISADHVLFDSVAERFGYPNVGNGSSNHNAVLTTHPLFNGPFGSFTTFNGYGDMGAFNQGSATLLSTNGNGSPSILETTIGNGVVVLLSDVDMISTWGEHLSGGSSITTNNDILLGNLFAYMADNSDTDNDGIPNIDDPHPNSNLSEELSFGGIYPGVENIFVAPGTTMMDEIDDVIAGVWEMMNSSDRRRNFDPQKQFQRDMSVLLNSWYRRYDRILSDADKFKITQSVRRSRIFNDPI